MFSLYADFLPEVAPGCSKYIDRNMLQISS